MDNTPARPSYRDPAARLVWPLNAHLGEGPIWMAGEQALWFVDIEGRQLHRFIPGSDQHDSFVMPGRPSFVVPAADGSMIIGMELGLYRVRAGVLAGRLAAIGGDPNCRSNDATVDAQGRLWFGTMDLARRASTGQVHVFDGSTVRPVGGHCPISNGPALSPDGKILYHVDTLAGIVWAFDISTRDMLGEPRVFTRISINDGMPDGVTVDAEGGVWVALWGGGAVRRYSSSGELLLSVAIPCAHVTKLAFGGENLRTGYVTTARVELSDEDLKAQPHAGGLFAFDSPVAGLPTHAVQLP